MGVSGLANFVKVNRGETREPKLLVGHKLQSTNLLIDVHSAVLMLTTLSQGQDRQDVLGADLVQYGQAVRRLFNNLRSCRVRPILAFDGAHTGGSHATSCDPHQSESFRRRQESLDDPDYRIQPLRHPCRFGPAVSPLARMILKSIAADMDVQVIQCMHEVQRHVKELTRRFRCPLMSLNGDFYLYDLPFGLIPAMSLRNEVIHSRHGNFISCKLFMKVNLRNVFPRMDLRNLGLLGALANNNVNQDEQEALWEISEQLKDTGRCDECRHEQLVKPNGDRYDKLVNILNNLCCRTYEDAVEYLCSLAPPDKQADVRSSIEANLTYYDPPSSVSLVVELGRICREGFFGPEGSASQDQDELEREFEAKMRKLTDWLLKGFEGSVITKLLLSLISDKCVFVSYLLEEPSWPGVGAIQLGQLRVLKSLMRTGAGRHSRSKVDVRLGEQYQVIDLEPLKNLPKFGQLDYLIYDLPEMSAAERRAILLATFHCSVEEFDQHLELFGANQDDEFVQEFFTVKLLLYANDVECPKLRLPEEFKRATLSSLVYYSNRRCSRISEDLVSFASDLRETVDKIAYTYRQPLEWTAYSRPTMHQIGQLQISIIAFNNLNALLGDPMRRVRSENWLNSCLIYNLTEDPDTLGDKIPAMIGNAFDLS